MTTAPELTPDEAARVAAFALDRDDERFLRHVFRSRDQREIGRLIRVLEWNPERGKYKVTEVDQEWEPLRHGSTTHISTKTLETRWKKVSR